MKKISRSKIQEAIHQSNLIEGIDSTKEDIQSLAAWDWLVLQPKIGIPVIRKLQKMITINQTDLLPNQRGYLRGEAGDRTDVRVGPHVGCPYAMVASRMHNWVLDLKDEDSRWMHAMFEEIHPFRDGNGRTGRMIMWYDQLQRGEDIWLIHAGEEQQAYYKWLRECELKVAGI